MDDLTNALVETGATIAFDAIGGGKLAGQILTSMEAAINKTAKAYSRYGSSVHKQVYIYGSLDTRPVEINRAFGMAWGVGGWLLFPFLMKIGPAEGQKLRERVVVRAQDHLRQPLHQSRVAAGGARPRQPRRLRQARDRREIPDQSEQGRMNPRVPGFDDRKEACLLPVTGEHSASTRAGKPPHVTRRGEQP